MFKWKIYTRQNIDGKMQSFEKSFDNYNEFVEFMNEKGFPSNHLTSGDGSDTRRAIGNTQMPALPVDLGKYEKEIKKIQVQESKKRIRKKQLEHAKSKLEQYKNTFESAGNKELMIDVEADLLKIDQEIKTLV